MVPWMLLLGMTVFNVVLLWQLDATRERLGQARSYAASMLEKCQATEMDLLSMQSRMRVQKQVDDPDPECRLRW